MKSIISIILVCIFTLQMSVNSFAAFDAPKLSKEEWNILYSSNIDSNTLPMLNVGADEKQVSLCWHADKETAKSKVRLSKNADMSNPILFEGITTAAESDSQVVCRVTVTGLEENTKYYYQWHSDNGWSDPKEYETKSFGDHKVLVVGDIQIAEIREDDALSQSAEGIVWNNLLSEALEKNHDISYLVSPGDNTSSGRTDLEWQTLLMPEAVRSLPFALAIGNHDKKGMTYNYFTNMPNEYYGKHFEGLDRNFWFRYGDVLYLVFDSTSGSAPDHMAFAKEAIRLNKDAKWRIGIVHHGIYGAGDAIGDMETEILLSSIFTPIFESFDLDLVITGHTHAQGRSHFMENRKVVQSAESGKTYTDPNGIVYLNSNSVNGAYYMDVEAKHLAYTFTENNIATYSTLEFKDNKLILETRRGDNSELLDSITIIRTKEYNENSFSNAMKRILYKPIELIGYVYVKIDSLVKKFS